MRVRRRGDRSADADGDGFAADALGLLDNLYGMALRLTRNPTAAEDLVQDTYLKAFRARARFEPGTNLKAWIFTILQNTWRNGRRATARARVEYDSAFVDRLADAGAGPDAPVAENAEALLLGDTLDADVRCALDALPEAFREAVWLRDVEGLSYQEIATTVDVPIGTVMSRISRGRKQLHDRLIARRPDHTPHPVERSGV